MGMSAGGNEGLFKLAEAAAPDENRLMPNERTYQKSSKTVSVEEAVALMKSRKKNPELRIKGGLDDQSDAVRVKPKANKGTQEVAKEDTSKSPEANEPLDVFKDVVREIGQTRKAQRSKTTGRVTTGEIAGLLAAIGSRVDVVDKLLGKVLAKIDLSSKPQVAPKDVLETFKSSSHKVTFIMNGMEFTVKCLNMIKDTTSHSMVFVFKDDGDSFFTPPMKAELKVKYDGIDESGQLYYFGMNFSVKDLGLKFLGFLYDESVNN